MGQFKVYQDYSQDATMVSNIFIDHYMQDANDAQIKIYLYLLRVLCSHNNCSISDLADQFNYTEKDVQRALKYWERNGLLALEYDDEKSLKGVRLLDVLEKTNNTVSLAPVVPIPLKGDNEATASNTANNKENIEKTYKKPSYSADEILNFKQNDSTAEIIFVVEQYLGKPLTPSEMMTLIFFSDELGFSPELIDYLFDYCLGRGKKDFRYIEKVAIGWKEEGITTPKQAAKATKKYDKIVYQVMNALGKSTSPTQREADFVNKWAKEYGYAFDIIQLACERTVLATDTHRFEYADKILGSWFKAKVCTVLDVEELDNAYEKKKKSANTVLNGTTRSVSYKQLAQRTYDFEELEKNIWSN